MTPTNHPRSRRAGLLAALTLLALATSLPALAVPVAVGSDYEMVIFESGGGGTSLTATVIFDGLPQNFALSTGGSATVTESQTSLGGAASRIVIDISADADLYAGTGSGNAFINIGRFSNPLDLLGAVHLTATRLTMTRADGSTASSTFGAISDPWQGFFLSAGVAGGLVGMANSDVRRITLTFDVVPEPATAALALLGLVAMRRRRRS